MKVKEVYNIFKGDIEVTDEHKTKEVDEGNISVYGDYNVTYIDSDYNYLILYVDEVIK